jgi:asparagine synthase (glutamine-hydrolysing)
MCGIAGVYFGQGDQTAAPARLMALYMERRGPDSQGEWHDANGGLSFGHRRLAIIDPNARADQPFISSDGRHVIVFNGEIYNYRALRAELAREGVEFRSEGDTEVILELFRRRGPSSFAALRGMFALAIWDIERRQLVLARDPYGIKPLYLAACPSGHMFASQVKALLATGLVSDTRDSAGVAGFFLWGSVPGDRTLYRDISAVPAGSYIVIDEGHHALPAVRYADISKPWLSSGACDDSDLHDDVRAAMLDTVNAHLVADVPVAVLLSGGIDSGAIAGLMAERGQRIEGITVQFSEFEGTPADEGPRAAQIAEHYGINRHRRLVTRDEFEGDLPAILKAMDQPSIDGVNTWFASKAVHEQGFKVVLSGVGGDELFCGYSTFHTIPRSRRFVALFARTPVSRGLMKASLSLAAGAMQQPKLIALGELGGAWDGAYFVHRGLVMPHELAGLIGEKRAAEGLEALASEPCTQVNADVEQAAVASLEATHYLQNQLLRDSDWASMAHSLELRTPLVDWALLNRLAPLVRGFADGQGKRLLAGAPARALPRDIVERGKTGFGLPIGEWLADLGVQAPPSMTRAWSRRWAWRVAQAFDLV